MLNKKIKEKLQNSKISVKWYNMGTWVKKEYKNLWELLEQEDIKIRRCKINDCNCYRISWSFGMQQIKTIAHTTTDIERALITMLAQKCLYLGDTYKITTRFKDYSF